MNPHDAAVSNALLIPDKAKTALAQFWKANSKQIAAVTSGGDTERILRVTYSVIYRNPKLIECTPFSLLNGIVLGHQMGLIFGTQEIFLVPFAGQATVIIGYQGKVKLALASQLIKSIHPEVILDGEGFDYEITQDGVRFSHRPSLRLRERSTETNVIAAYCQVTTSTGGVQTRICPLSEILDARSRSRGYQYQVKKNATDNPWFTDFGAMAMKTAIHRAMKLAPQDARMSLSNSVDDEEEGGTAVIADGLNPADFANADLMAPLAETGADEQAKIASEKIAKKPRARVVDKLPDPIPEVIGARVAFEGKLYQVVETPEGRDWVAE